MWDGVAHGEQVICDDKPLRLRGSPWSRVWAFATQPGNLVDLVAILPYWVRVLFGGNVDLSFLRAMRLVRMLRLLKFGRYSILLQLVFGAMQESFVTLVILFLLLLIVIIMMFMLPVVRLNPPPVIMSTLLLIVIIGITIHTMVIVIILIAVGTHASLSHLRALRLVVVLLPLPLARARGVIVLRRKL